MSTYLNFLKKADDPTGNNINPSSINRHSGEHLRGISQLSSLQLSSELLQNGQFLKINTKYSLFRKPQKGCPQPGMFTTRNCQPSFLVKWKKGRRELRWNAGRTQETPASFDPPQDYCTREVGSCSELEFASLVGRLGR